MKLINWIKNTFYKIFKIKRKRIVTESKTMVSKTGMNFVVKTVQDEQGNKTEYRVPAKINSKENLRNMKAKMEEISSEKKQINKK